MSGDNWRTPDWLFSWAMDFFGRFGLDVCASRENAKCIRFFSEENSCLTHDWGNDRFLAWCNPPYSNPLPFVQKAIEQAQRTDTVFLVPADCSTKWFQLLWENSSAIVFLNRRIKFMGTTGSPKFGSVFFRVTKFGSHLKKRIESISKEDLVMAENEYRELNS